MKCAFSPAGDLLAFAQGVPIARQPTLGYTYVPFVRQRIFVAKLTAGPPQEIAGIPGAHYSLPMGTVWGPDGRYMLLIAAVHGTYGLAYWDSVTRKVTHLPGRLSSAFPSCAFLAGGRLVYASIADDAVQSMSKTQMLSALDRKWRAAWRGEASTPTVSSANPLFETTRPAVGTLMLADLSSGTVVSLSEGDYAYGAIHAAADGMRFAAVRSGKDIAESIAPEGRQGELQIFDLTPAGAVLRHRFDDLDFSAAAIAWAPSGKRLLSGAKPVDAGIERVGLYDIDVRSGARVEIRANKLSFINLDVQAVGGLLPIGWIGDQPAAIAARAGVAGQEAPSARARLEYGETLNRRFDLYVFRNGRARSLTEFSPTSVTTFLAPPAQSFAFVTANGALWRVGPNAAPERLSPRGALPIIGFGVVRRPAPMSLGRAYYRARNAERIALWGMTAEGAPEYRVFDLQRRELRPASKGELMDSAFDLDVAAFKVDEGWVSHLRIDGGVQRLLATFNAELAQRTIARPERFTYKVGEEQLTGWVLKPPGAEPGVRLPAVMVVYGGMVYGADSPMWAKPEMPYPTGNGQLLAAHGYAVIYPSTPLKAGADGDLPAMLAEQSVSAIDALATMGVVDADRVAVMGQSFGGFSTAAILSRRSDRFKAGVAMAGVFDWAFGYGMRALEETLVHDGRNQRMDMQLIETGQVRLGKPFWRDPQPYMRNSPIFRVDDLDAPLLLLHGDLDNSQTSLAGAERMYNALVRAGKKPVLVRYWGEGHVAESEAAMRDQWARITTWFDHHLRP